jgi:hypothetical protein
MILTQSSSIIINPSGFEIINELVHNNSLAAGLVFSLSPYIDDFGGTSSIVNQLASERNTSRGCIHLRNAERVLLL